MCAHSLFSRQDFAVPSKLIMQQWQMRKAESEQTIADLVRNRCPRAIHSIGVVEALTEREQQQEQKKQVLALMLELEKTLGAFRSHPQVDKWYAEHVRQLTTPHFRSSCLLLRGESQAGKTRQGASILGIQRTLIVNCQGLQTALPSLREYCRNTHDAIVFDEITEEQVLANKMVFQCGPQPVELSQSVCNQHSYRRWFYNCAMILCSNTFRMSHRDGLKDPTHVDWLCANIYDARLAKGEKWYMKGQKKRGPAAISNPARRSAN